MSPPYCGWYFIFAVSPRGHTHTLTYIDRHLINYMTRSNWKHHRSQGCHASPAGPTRSSATGIYSTLFSTDGDDKSFATASAVAAAAAAVGAKNRNHHNSHASPLRLSPGPDTPSITSGGAGGSSSSSSSSSSGGSGGSSCSSGVGSSAGKCKTLASTINRLKWVARRVIWAYTNWVKRWITVHGWERPVPCHLKLPLVVQFNLPILIRHPSGFPGRQRSKGKYAKLSDLSWP